jgi:RHS repeat-associated protein
MATNPGQAKQDPATPPNMPTWVGESAPVTLRVNAPPMVSLAAPASGSVFNPPANITVTANAADADGTIAKVDFYAGTTLIGTALSAPYSVTWADPAPGTYSLAALATDNDGAATTSIAVSIRVNAPPTVSLTGPTNGASFTAPATVPLAASATDTDGTIAKVEFFQDTTLIASVTTPPYTFSWTNVAQGSYTLTAVATDNDGASATSAAVTITVNSGVAQIYYIQTDHLNTARLIQDQAGNAVWRWDQGEPFGNDVPNSNPSGVGAFDFPLRLPGQYYDRETALHYNMMRDYDPSIGRYVESDPIGLKGGLNTYAYVDGRPLSAIDPSGLALLLCFRSCCGGIANHSYFWDDKTKQCCGDPGWFTSRKNPLATCPEAGPPTDYCTLISSNDEDTKKALRCCNTRTNESRYFPTLSDCHNRTDECIRELGMAPQATPSGNRWRPCPSCARQ